jgi:hypothetical protein
METDQPTTPQEPPEPRPTRREATRRRVRTLKVGAAVAASGVFVATGAAAHEAHPGGETAALDGSLTVPSEFAQRLEQSDDFGEGGSIGPFSGDGGGVPRTGTHTS